MTSSDNTGQQITLPKRYYDEDGQDAYETKIKVEDSQETVEKKTKWEEYRVNDTHTMKIKVVEYEDKTEDVSTYKPCDLIFIYSCDECGEQFSKAQDLEHHLIQKHTSTLHKEQHAQEYFQCEQCNTSVKSRKGLLRHVNQQHEAERFSCLHCDY